MARNPNQNSNSTWNDNHRFNNQDDRIMRRGDDRTRESRDYGTTQMNERPEYRNDYPADKEMSSQHGRANYGSGIHPSNYQNTQSSQTQNYGSSNDDRPSYDQGFSTSSGSMRDNGWSSDNSSNSWRTRGQSWDANRGNDRWAAQETQGFDRTYGRQDNMYGQGGDLSNSQRSYGGSTNFGSVTTDSLRTTFGTPSTNQWGPHSGKGPKNYKRSDERIKEDVSDALERNPHVDASEIEIEVKDGIVMLRGHVEDRRTKRATEDAIEHLQGVRDIRNELQVDQSLFTQAKNALFGESVESQSASTTNSNKSTGTKPRH